MKKLLRICGVILIVCGIGLYLIGGKAQKDLEPNEVKVGYMSNGELVVTDSGYMGGNVEGQKEMGKLQGIGIAAGIGGVVALGASFVFSDDRYGTYE